MSTPAHVSTVDVVGGDATVDVVGHDVVDVTAADAEWILDVVERWDHCYRWSLRGRTPSPAGVERSLTAGVTWQRVVREGGRPVAVVQVADVDPDSGYGQLAVLAEPGLAGPLVEAVRSLVAGLLPALGLRKLCIAAEEDGLDVPALLGSAARAAGRLREHELRPDGSYADVLVHEVWRAEGGDAPGEASVLGDGPAGEP